MNKKYIDFVPAKKTKKTESKVAGNTMTKGAVITSARAVGGARARSDGANPNPVKNDELRELKSRKLLGKRLKKKSEEASSRKNVAKQNERGAALRATYRMPNPPFINQEKVVKRPLSKNVYQKKIEVPEEKSSGPVAIISKPAKDKNVSLVVTIIITIILGAAAGTVAFLLLPK